MEISDLRTEYTRHGLSEGELSADPMEQFRRWFESAIEAGVREPNAMTLATVDGEGRPAARIVLLKGAESDGFRFFTNYESAKGRELGRRPEAALVFFWSELERQVRVEGPVERLAAQDSDAYFDSRPMESRVGAWASDQSQPIGSRAELEAKAVEVRERIDGAERVARPPHWGGYVLRPRRVEFWQGRPARLHDRLVYRRESQGGWSIVRLQP
ncbi:MAG: pyridoxamine 5'-phosphate oxidase [Planctomycetota bacterium]|jgi:pyridoxamine 5'-phosphate oxidase